MCVMGEVHEHISISLCVWGHDGVCLLCVVVVGGMAVVQLWSMLKAGGGVRWPVFMGMSSPNDQRKVKISPFGLNMKRNFVLAS